MDGSAFCATSSSWSRFNEGSRRKGWGGFGGGAVWGGLGAGAGRGGGVGAGPPHAGPGVLYAAICLGMAAMQQKHSFLLLLVARALILLYERNAGLPIEYFLQPSHWLVQL